MREYPKDTLILLVYLHLHNRRVVVAAQIQVGRIIIDAPQAGGVEDVVDAQHALGIAVGVHISVSGSTETIFEDFP